MKTVYRLRNKKNQIFLLLNVKEDYEDWNGDAVVTFYLSERYGIGFYEAYSLDKAKFVKQNKVEDIYKYHATEIETPIHCFNPDDLEIVKVEIITNVIGVIEE